MGLCFPKQCSIPEIKDIMDELIIGFAQGVGWTNVSVDYDDSSKYADDSKSEMKAGAIIFGLIMAVAICLLVIGCTFE